MPIACEAPCGRDAYVPALAEIVEEGFESKMPKANDMGLGFVAQFKHHCLLRCVDGLPSDFNGSWPILVCCKSKDACRPN